MNCTLPGTGIPVQSISERSVDDSLRALFSAGGVVLSQVTALTGLEPYQIQNWIRRGFVSSPVHRQYTERQFCRIVIIQMLRDSMPLDSITKMLSYINGALDDESDDRIDDGQLYRLFARLHAALDGTALTGAEVREAIDSALSGYIETIPDSRARIAEVLEIMIYAYRSSELHRRADELLRNLGAGQK